MKTVEERENVMHNLIILSEIIQFPVRKNKEGKVVANNIFNKNPIPFIRIGLKKHVGAKFTSGIITDTDITASQYVNSFDIALGFAQTKKQELLDALVLELYPTIKSHINKVTMAIKWIIWFRFTGVIDYFANHPIYSVLYTANKEVSEDKIRLGMTEAIISLTSSGFGRLQELKSISVIEFFDTQFKDLKNKDFCCCSKRCKISRYCRYNRFVTLSNFYIMLNLIDILTYYAKFVPKRTLKKVFKQANKSSEYTAFEKTLLNLPEADIVEEIEGFVVSINDNYLTAQVKSCKGTILFIEHGNISLYGDIAQKVSCDIAVTVAAPLANSNSDSIKEALVMNSILGVLNKIVDKMKDVSNTLHSRQPLCRYHLRAFMNLLGGPQCLNVLNKEWSLTAPFFLENFSTP